MSIARPWSLPMEQGMVAGGLGSVAFLEVLGFAQSFLQAKLEHIWGSRPDMPHLRCVEARYGNLVGIDQWPMVAREGVVGGMLLTKNGIFYLRTKDLLLYRSIATTETRNNHGSTHTYAASKLSDHAFDMYKKMLDGYGSADKASDYLKNKNKKDFEMLMYDCLLHMLLNDFAVALNYVKPRKETYKNAIAAMLALMQKVTLTPTPQRMLSRLGESMGLRRGETLIEKTSTQCLEEWTREHEATIKDEILEIFSEIRSKLFFRDIDAWRNSSPENSQNEQWKHSYNQNGLDFNKKVGCISTELESFNAPTRSSDSWERIGRLRYCINARG